MLGGLDPVIIFQFSKKVEPPNILFKIPVSKDDTFIDNPPIPVYLSEVLFGVVFNSESRNIDIETNTESLSTTTDETRTQQKAITSGISINMQTKKDNILLQILSAMADSVFERVTSKEYTISYMHGPIVVFRGLVHSITVDTVPDNDLASIKIDISRGQKTPTSTIVPSVPAAPPTVTETIPIPSNVA